jgi:hypothetical protein
MDELEDVCGCSSEELQATRPVSTRRLKAKITVRLKRVT